MKYKSYRSRWFLIGVIFLHCFIIPSQLQAGSGDIDTLFGGGGAVFASVALPDNRVRVQADGKIVTLSSNASGAGAWDYAWIFNQGSAISRHNSDGTLDPTFGSNGTYTIGHNYPNSADIFINFAIQGDGKLLIVGRRGADYSLFRFNANGTRDLLFGNGGLVITRFTGFNMGSAQGVAFLADGKIITSGWASPMTSMAGSRVVMVRYHADGTPDTDFGVNGILIDNNISTGTVSAFGNEIVVSPGGKLIVSASRFAGKSSMIIAEYHADGTRDNSFGTNGIVDTEIEFGRGMVLQADGKIVVNGLSGFSLSFIKRYDENGLPDPSFGSNGVASITEPEPYPQARGIAHALAIDDRGKILTAGGRNGAFAISRYNPDGNIDASFGKGGVTITALPNSSISGLALQADGKIVATGFSSDATSGQTTLVRYLSDQASPTSTVSGQVLTPGGLGLRNATVTITHRDGSRRTATTGSLGYFSLSNVETGYAVRITVSSRRYRFEPQYKMITGNLSNIDFIALE